jgi:hypothetical protein
MKADDYAWNGQVQIREEGAHPRDARGYTAEHANGLTKKEYFAGLFMQAHIMGNIKNFSELAGNEAALFAMGARAAAEVLIAELNKGEPK